MECGGRWFGPPLSHGCLPLFDVHLNTPLTLDPKGRITLPSRLKTMLDNEGANVLVCIPHKGHLRLYTKPGFKEHVAAEFVGKDRFDPIVERKQRLRMGLAAEVQVDAQGRVNVPPNLRAMAGLERDVMLLSIDERLELWDQARFDAWLAAALAAEDAEEAGRA